MKLCGVPSFGVNNSDVGLIACADYNAVYSTLAKVCVVVLTVV